MAIAKIKRHIAGVTIDLTRAEVYGIVNTAERMGEIFDTLKAGKSVSTKELRSLFFEYQQGYEELALFFDVAKAASVMMSAETQEEVCPL